MSFDKKEISLHGDRKLINRCREAGLELYNPRGPFNGYGYTTLPLAVVIGTEDEMDTFMRIKAEVEAMPKKAPKTKMQRITAWARRLYRLLDGELTMEECIDLANEKLEAKEQQVYELMHRQDDYYSVKREKLIDAIIRSDPLRYIRDVNHAYHILAASERHNATNYEELLEDYHEEERMGLIPMGSAREYARRDMQSWRPNTAKQEVPDNG